MSDPRGSLSTGGARAAGRAWFPLTLGMGLSVPPPRHSRNGLASSVPAPPPGLGAVAMVTAGWLRIGMCPGRCRGVLEPMAGPL